MFTEDVDPLACTATPVAPHAVIPKPKRIRKPAAKKPKATKRKPAVKKPKAKKRVNAPKKPKATKRARKSGAKIGRPRVSKYDDWKMQITGKRKPRPGTVRFRVAGAFSRPRTVASAVDVCSKGFKPPKHPGKVGADAAQVAKDNPGRYFRLVILSMWREGVLRKVK